MDRKISKMTDDQLKTLLEEAYSLPKMVSDRIDDSLFSLPKKNSLPSFTASFLYRLKKQVVVPVLGIALLITGATTTPPIAANYMLNEANKNEAYIIYQDHYYKVTGNQLDDLELGEEISRVTRVGNWNIKRNGDSNHFIPSSPIYRIKGREDVIAVKSTMLHFFNSYIELERAGSIEIVNKDPILGAKNDPEETSIALENVKALGQMTYSFPEDFDRVNLTFVSLENDNFVKLYYKVPEADNKQNTITMQGYLFIYQYSKHMEIPGISRFTPEIIHEQIDERTRILKPDPYFTEPVAVHTFVINDIEWSYYSNQLLRGELGIMYYEIQTQGIFSIELLVELLAHFKPDDESSISAN